MTDWNDILKTVRSMHADADIRDLQRAYLLCCRVCTGEDPQAGEPRLRHPLEVARILAGLKMDMDTVVAGMLHELPEDGLITLKELRDEFGAGIADLVEIVNQIGKISFHSGEEKQAENFRRMLLATARDIRVVIVRLADRLDTLRILERYPESVRRQAAQEIFDIYAPLANRLGISWLKCELEDYAFRYLMPDVYADLAAKVAAKLKERDDYITSTKREIEDIMKRHGLRGTVTGRIKHLYSIYAKLKRQKIEFEQLYDLAAFRVIVRDVGDCYAMLGIVHSEWRPIPGRVKDYIALPKANMYQSLHTTVMGPSGKPIEIQIRTEEMHRVAEAGIAAHWKYKEGRVAERMDPRESGQLAWLRQMLEWHQELQGSREFLQSVKSDLLSDMVYVFTPTGEVRELPRGATPIDFAYSIHSGLGDHCFGAKVDGRLVPLRTELANGNIVEVLTSSSQTPSKDWLNFVRTSKARNKIRQWIKTAERSKSIELGREMLEKELRRHGASLKRALQMEAFHALAAERGFKNEEDLLAALGYGKITLGQIVGKLFPEEHPHPGPFLNIPENAPARPGSPRGSVVRIQGLDNVLFHFAKCCNPLPGDRVVGFITRGRGITVHVADCPHVHNEDPERLVEVEWPGRESAPRGVKIRVFCRNRKGALAAMTGAITDCEANILSAVISSRDEMYGVNLFEIEVSGLDHLNRVFDALTRLKDVDRVERVHS
ncbi:MAG: bifunctional (p)ppGpp synthetase/guanosine-3',5'-bis(diphosphate) 3'-pyrophosphohydrolase [Deltaproteobacteria bacterium]|nr:bifunctional (p)ppGpp synthetase/guanosine-3',5'-bis(diphosphate) 3'-pyrophosphohydrolase [Deltaproteobacteria bacterium]